MNQLFTIEICQAYFTYAKEISGKRGDEILDRLANIGFLGNNEMKPGDLTGKTLELYNQLCNNVLALPIVNRKAPIG